MHTKAYAKNQPIDEGINLAELHEIWEKALSLLNNSMTKVVFDSLIKVLKPLSCDNGLMIILTPKAFFKDTLETRYKREIINCIQSVSDIELSEVLFVSPEDMKSGFTQRVVSDGYNKTNLRAKFVFETFVKGKCNELAYAAAQAVADVPGADGYNPLFLYGGVGLGKTHLIHSIGNRLLDFNPDLKIMYVSSETFTNEFITSIREQTTQEFKNKYRSVDVLLIDDIQFIGGKNETQEEMFHTFNDLHSANKQIVLTSDVPPKELTELEARLTSRFTAGLIADITMPDYETRTAILEKKMDIEKVEIPQPVKEFITRNIVSNIRDLEGALNKVTAWARLKNIPITLESAETALRDQLVGRTKPEITISYIQTTVAAHFKITQEEMNSRKKNQGIVMPRQIAMYLCRKILDVSLPEVGKQFGGRDHSTVIHSCEKISNEMDADDKLRILLEELEHKIKGE